MISVPCLQLNFLFVPLIRFVSSPLPEQDFKPRIHVTNSDFASITENGVLCDENGQMGQACECLGRQLLVYYLDLKKPNVGRAVIYETLILFFLAKKQIINSKTEMSYWTLRLPIVNCGVITHILLPI